MRKATSSIVLSVVISVLMTAIIWGRSPLYAAENTTITFASEEWQYATNKDGTGLYWDIFRAVFEPEGYTIETKLCTYDASVRMVETQKVDAMVGAYEDEFEKGIFPQMHFAVDEVQAMYRKGEIGEWQGVNAIQNKTVAWIKGYSYDDYLDPDLVRTLDIKRVLDRKAIFRMVDAGKVNVVLDATSDITDFFKANSEYDENNYERNTFLELKLFTVFAQTDKGKALADIFDRRFKELVQSGAIKKTIRQICSL